MTRGFVAIVIAVAVFMTAPFAWASVPDPNNSCWRWTYPMGYCQTMPFVCPAGDGSSVVGCIKDQFGNPMVGVLVGIRIRFHIPSCIWIEIYIPCVTGAGGTFVGSVETGVDVLTDNPEGLCADAISTVTCMGVTIPYCGTCDCTQTPPGQNCSDSHAGDLLSPDLNGDGMVEPLDYSIFAGDWLTDRCRCDFNCDGIVEPLDYSIFVAHWLHVSP